MRAEKLAYLEKKYESKLAPKEDFLQNGGPMGKPGPNMPGHGRRGARGGMPGGKPRNVKKTVGRLLGYLGNQKLKLGIVFLCVIGGTAANLAGSYMLRPIINGLTSRVRRC